MNSAARVLNQNTISRTWVISVLLSKTQYTLMALTLGVLVSALSVVYIINTTRTLNATLQQAFNERDHLHIRWSQLLLEKSTWITQARVQEVAANKLNMEIPGSHSVVIIKE